MNYLLAIVLVIGLLSGGELATWTFFGLLTFMGLVGIVETIPPIRWLVHSCSQTIDVLFFGFTIIATMNYGVTITASLTIAGLCFTFFYRSYIRGLKEKENNVMDEIQKAKDRGYGRKDF